jgi:deoxyribose-phosphate aldolase
MYFCVLCDFIINNNSYMNIRQFLDSTYLKTASQAGLSESDNSIVVQQYVQEAINENFKLIMIRPDQVSLAKAMIDKVSAVLQIGTVIDFPEGKSIIQDKLIEATSAIENGADELDFVCNYEAFKAGEIELVKEEIVKGTQLGLAKGKIVKWIIEVAALSDKQIIQLSALIKNCIISNFEEKQYCSVFVKSSTGFFITEEGLPNGATIPSIIMMLENASPLPVKAAGGVKTYTEALEMIQMGVKRIGTSAAKAIANGATTESEY